jgi:hypothetical protein
VSVGAQHAVPACALCLKMRVARRVGFKPTFLGWNQDYKMPRITFKVICLITTALFVSGCPIPFPHVKKLSPPIYGKVLDANSLAPLPGVDVQISYLDDKSRCTTTDENGDFEFPAKYRFYYGVLFCVALNYSIPPDDDARRISTIEISTPDYIPVRINCDCFYHYHSCYQLICLKRAVPEQGKCSSP